MTRIVQVLFVILTLLALYSLADESADPVTTNRYIISNTVEKKAWRRDFPSVDKDGKLVDKTGKLATVSNDEAVNMTITLAEQIAASSNNGVTNTLAQLSTATNQVTDRLESFSVQFIRRSPVNLQGHVIKYWYEGGYDYQYVRFNKIIAQAPKRKIVYTLPAASVAVDCEWIDWSSKGEYVNGYGGCHKCRVARPSTVGSTKVLAYANDIFGGSQGFDFGSMTVFVDGTISVTGVYTGKTTNAILEIDNGVIKKWQK